MTRADEIATEFEGAGANGAAPHDDGTAPGPRPTATESDALLTEPASGNGRGHHHARRHLHLHPEVDIEAASAGPGRAEEIPPVDEPGLDSPSAPADEPSAAGDDSSRTENGGDAVVETEHHESLPEMARHAAGMWLKAAGWTAGTSLRVGNELRRMATDPNSAQEVIDEVTKEVREVARDFLGITELASEVEEMAPLLSTGLLKPGVSSPEALRAQGEQLLREAADVGFDEGAHPAFARILTELSPDEARILRLLAIEGPQPMVDIRAHNLIGNGSQLIAQALNMLGPKAGLRQRDRVAVYLTNLARLNLAALSDEPLESPVQYQVLEAQPEVMSVTRDTVRAKIVRRSVSLTPLGREFCDVCLPVNLPALPPPTAG